MIGEYFENNNIFNNTNSGGGEETNIGLKILDYVESPIHELEVRENLKSREHNSKFHDF